MSLMVFFGGESILYWDFKSGWSSAACASPFAPLYIQSDKGSCTLVTRVSLANQRLTVPTIGTFTSTNGSDQDPAKSDQYATPDARGEAVQGHVDEPPRRSACVVILTRW